MFSYVGRLQLIKQVFARAKPGDVLKLYVRASLLVPGARTKPAVPFKLLVCYAIVLCETNRGLVLSGLQLRPSHIRVVLANTMTYNSKTALLRPQNLLPIFIESVEATRISEPAYARRYSHLYQLSH